MLPDMAYSSSGGNYVLTDPRADSEAEVVKPDWVSLNYFEMLGTVPGRTFPSEEGARGDRVAALSYRMWQQRFGGAAA